MQRAPFFLAAIFVLAISLIFFLKSPRDESLPQNTGAANQKRIESAPRIESVPHEAKRTTLFPSTDRDGQGKPDTPPPTPPESILVAGRVLDVFETPVVNATISVQVQELRDGKTDEFAWVSLRSFSGTTIADGSFTINGLGKNQNYRLAIYHAEILTTYKDFQVGAENLVIHALRSWAIGGLVLVDEEVSERPYSITVYKKEDGPNSSQARRTKLNIRNGWKLERLTEGIYVLELNQGLSTPSLYSRELVLGPEGGRERQPDIDLRNKIKVLTLTILGSDRNPTSFCWVSDLNGVPLGSGALGSVSFLSTKSTIDVEVGAEGCRNRIIRGVSGDLEVQLKPGFPVQILVETPEVPKGWDWYCVLKPQSNGQALHPSDTKIVLFRDIHGGIVRVPHSGAYQVIIQLMDTGSISEQSLGSWIPIPICEKAQRPVWEILNSEELQIFHYLLTSEELQSIKSIVLEVNQ